MAFDRLGRASLAALLVLLLAGVALPGSTVTARHHGGGPLSNPQNPPPPIRLANAFCALDFATAAPKVGYTLTNITALPFAGSTDGAYGFMSPAAAAALVPLWNLTLALRANATIVATSADATSVAVTASPDRTAATLVFNLSRDLRFEASVRLDVALPQDSGIASWRPTVAVTAASADNRASCACARACVYAR